MIDVTSAFDHFAAIAAKCWKVIAESLGDSFDDNRFEADESLAVALSSLLSLIVEGQPSIHAESIRSPLTQEYPYIECSSLIRLLVQGSVEGALVEGPNRGQWQKAKVTPGKVLGYLDLFDFEMGPTRTFAYFKAYDFEEHRAYLIPRGEAVRVMRSEEEDSHQVS